MSTDNQHQLRLFELITNNQLEQVLVVDSSGQIIYQSEAARQARHAAEGVDESTVGFLLHPDDREMALDALRALLTGQNDIHQNTYRLKQHDGSYHWVLIRGKKLRDASGDTGMVLVSWIDVHDKVQVELALRESEEKYRLLADNAADFIQLLSIDGKYLYDSPSVVRLLGDDYQIGRRLAEGITLIHPDDRALARDTLVDVFRSGSERRLDYRWVLPSGDVRYAMRVVKLRLRS